jgi:hypothetical protein
MAVSTATLSVLEVAGGGRAAPVTHEEHRRGPVAGGSKCFDELGHRRTVDPPEDL